MMKQAKLAATLLSAISAALFFCALPAQAHAEEAAALSSPIEALPELGELPAELREGWLALLHYRSAGAGTWRSEVHQPSFFLDERGEEDPEREWRANLRAFRSPAPTLDERSSSLAAEQPAELPPLASVSALAGNAPPPALVTATSHHAQCRFPARFAFARRALGWSEAQVPLVRCPDVDDFRARTAARSLAVVFASHYLANPASAFGHTMLYLGSTAPLDARLVDSSVGFEADTRGMTPLSYIPRGLRGGLTAGFRVSPFYDRVRKYERQELRDIWLFPLKLPAAELEQLVRHLWEMRDVSYRYGFFGENCAQKILALVHAIGPQYKLLPFPSAAVLPSDVVRRLVESIGLAGEPVLRPSLLGRYDRQRDALASAERDLLDRMISARTAPPEASPAVISAAILWSELNLPYRTFRRAAENLQPDHPLHRDLQWKRALLAARAAHGGATAQDAAAQKNPDASLSVADEAWQRAATLPSLLDAHAPSRVTIRGGARRGDAALGVGMRWLLHDPIDPHAGYPQLSTLEVLRLELGLSAADVGTLDTPSRTLSLFVDEVTALRVEKLAPASSLQSNFAWRLELGARRLPYDDGTHLHAGAELAAGLGASSSTTRNASIAAYAMLGARPAAVFTTDDVTFAPAALATAGVLARLGGLRARLHAETSLSLRSFSLETAATATLRFPLSSSLDLELLSTATPTRALTTTSLTAMLGLVVFQ